MQTVKVIRVRTLHGRGLMARLLQEITSAKAMLNSIETTFVGQHRVYRDITLEVENEAQFEELLGAIRSIPDLEIDQVIDDVLFLHEGGKMSYRGRDAVKTLAKLRKVYTPGVAKVCNAIQQEPELIRRFTNAGNTIAVLSNGTRVLGLGNLGPRAVLPVLESKALFYGQFVDLNAVPLIIDTEDVQEFVETVLRIAPGFAGIHLEDIRSPDCLEIERLLIERLDIPVMHDDQHGTAVVALAAISNMLRLANRRLEDMTITQVGLGAAGLATARLIKAAGARRVVGFDPNSTAAAYAKGHGIEVMGLDEAMASADLACLATGIAGMLSAELIRRGHIILALSNPRPEIEIEDALAAGAALVADGRTVNNLLCYPGLFKGAIAAGARRITDGMKLAAARAIAELAAPGEILPNALDQRMHMSVASAVQLAAAAERERTH